MRRFDLAAIAPTPWKNGGGATRELACWPPGAGLQDFEWRVSVATIAQPGPFSAFDGVDRQIMLLAGDGVHLRGPGIDHRLQQAWQPFAFAGEARVSCTLLGRPSTDFNLMLRRGAWRGGIALVRGHRLEPPWPAAGLCLVLAGTWLLDAAQQQQHGDGQRLAAGQGAWWGEGEAAPLRCTPVAGEGGQAPVLAHVALQRCGT